MLCRCGLCCVFFVVEAVKSIGKPIRMDVDFSCVAAAGRHVSPT